MLDKAELGYCCFLTGLSNSV